MVVERRWSPQTKRVVIFAAAVVAAFLLWKAGEIVAPFLWALVVGYVMLPGVSLFERRGLRRGLAAGIVFLIFLGAIALIGRVVAPIAAAQLRDAQREVPILLRNAEETAAAALTQIGLGDLDALVLIGGDLPQSLGRMVVPLAAAVGRFTLELLIFLVGVFFVLRDGPRLYQTLEGVIPREQRAEVLHVVGQASGLISRYIRGQLVLVIIMSTATAIGLSLLEVPYSVVLGLLTGVLELIPFVGPITAGALASVVALGHPNPFGWEQLWYVAAVAVMYTVFRHTEDYVVIPLVIGRIVRLHPLVVIFSVLAGGAIYGLLGVILAVPTAATVRLVLIYVLAKFRDEDPLAQLEREIEAAEESRERSPATQAVRGPTGP